MAWTWRQVLVASGRTPTIILFSLDGKPKYSLTSRNSVVTETITVIPLAAYWLFQSAKKKRNAPKENVKDQGDHSKEPPTTSPTYPMVGLTGAPKRSDRVMV